MDGSEQLDVRTVAALLRAQGTAIRVELEALGDEASRWHPAEGEWCANEALGHILEAERRGFNGRIRTILAEENPSLEGWDQVAVARERRDCERPSADLLREFETIREDSARLVEGLRPEQLDRGGRHAQVGDLTIRDLIHEWVHHDRNHVKQIFSTVQEYVWPHMGNARRFSEVD